MEMTVNLSRKDDHMHFEAENDRGNVVSIDGGEDSKGMRPMELLLSGIASCAAFDAVHILKKQKQDVTDFQISVKGERSKEGTASPFKSIYIDFTLKGNIQPEKAERAVKLSVEKYCSVGATLRPETAITYNLNLTS
jgi:putative redox protein